MIICVIGPGGSGKSTCVNNYLKKHSAGCFVSNTTRAKRKDEVDGREYNFLTQKEFISHEYIETTVYNGQLYGLSKSEADKKLSMYDIVFFVCDAEGYKLVKETYGEDNVKSIFLKVPSSTCIYSLIQRDNNVDLTKNRVYYDCLTDAYTLDDKIPFDAIVRRGASIEETGKIFEKTVAKLTVC